MTGEKCWLVGVDEAGRGSLVGEMIVAALAVPESDIPLLVEEGVRDSKTLSPAARRRLYRLLSKRYPFAAVPVTPSEIDSENLNTLTARAAAKAVGVLAARLGGYTRICRVTVDKFGDPSRLILMLRRQGYRGPIVVEPRGDARYPEVSGASIIAKHVRDARVRVLSSMYGVEGSGYPSDPRTISWLERVLRSGSIPPVVRRSWDTLRGTPFYVEKKKAGKSKVTLEDFF